MRLNYIIHHPKNIAFSIRIVGVTSVSTINANLTHTNAAATMSNVTGLATIKYTRNQQNF